MEKSPMTSLYTERTSLRANPLQPMYFARQLSLKNEREGVRTLIKKVLREDASSVNMLELVHELHLTPNDDGAWVAVLDRDLGKRGLVALEPTSEPQEITDNQIKAEMTYAPRTFITMWDIVRSTLLESNCVSYILRETQRLTVATPLGHEDHFLLRWMAEKVYGPGKKDVVAYSIILNCEETLRRRALFNDSQALVTAMATDPQFSRIMRRFMDEIRASASNNNTPRDTASDSSVAGDDEDDVLAGTGRPLTPGRSMFVQVERTAPFPRRIMSSTLTASHPVATHRRRRSSSPPEVVVPVVEAKADDDEAASNVFFND